MLTWCVTSERYRHLHGKRRVAAERRWVQSYEAELRHPIDVDFSTPRPPNWLLWFYSS